MSSNSLSGSAPQLTAGEECQAAAKSLSSFLDTGGFHNRSGTGGGGGIPGAFVASAMGLAILKGDSGVAVVRLKTKEWSAPCAICLQNNVTASQIQSGQETVLLFMTQKSIYSLVGRSPLMLGSTHTFSAGPLSGTALNLNPSIDVYAYVRFNGGFTPSELIDVHMRNWSVSEDSDRHGRWHGKNVTWFDVLTNKITVDRSSVGNALYVVLNLAAAGSAGGLSHSDQNNVADLDALVGIPPSSTNNTTKQQTSASELSQDSLASSQPLYHTMNTLVPNNLMTPEQQFQFQYHQQQQQNALLFLQQQQQLQQQLAYQQMLLQQQVPFQGMSMMNPTQSVGIGLTPEQQQQLLSQSHQQTQTGAPYMTNSTNANSIPPGSGLLGNPSSYQYQ